MFKQHFKVGDKVTINKVISKIHRIVYNDHSIHGYVYELNGEGLPWYSDDFLMQHCRQIYLGGE